MNVEQVGFPEGALAGTLKEWALMSGVATTMLVGVDSEGRLCRAASLGFPARVSEDFCDDLNEFLAAVCRGEGLQ